MVEVMNIFTVNIRKCKEDSDDSILTDETG